MKTPNYLFIKSFLDQENAFKKIHHIAFINSWYLKVPDWLSHQSQLNLSLLEEIRTNKDEALLIFKHQPTSRSLLLIYSKYLRIHTWILSALYLIKINMNYWVYQMMIILIKIVGDTYHYGYIRYRYIASFDSKCLSQLSLGRNSSKHSRLQMPTKRSISTGMCPGLLTPHTQGVQKGAPSTCEPRSASTRRRRNRRRTGRSEGTQNTSFPPQEPIQDSSQHIEKTTSAWSSSKHRLWAK